MDDLSLHSGHAEGVGAAIVQAAQDGSPVSGLTHGFYRYPARFSPLFARAVIEAFTEPGDWVLDPFAGGGTTLVEAMAAGRNALGIDISALAAFVCEAKTQYLSDADEAAFQRWLNRLPEIINMHAPSCRFEGYAQAGYYRNLEGPQLWRLRKAIEQALASVERLRCNGAHILARCAVLRTAQWALDGRKTKPSVPGFRAELLKQAEAMLDGALKFREKTEAFGPGHVPYGHCLNRSTAGAENEEAVQAACPPKLILTSPPYPGIHVLYHRWQIDGRREAPSPFWIAGKLDGAGSSYYTMGDRKYPRLDSYFSSLEASFRSIARMAGPETVIVQMVSFSEAEWQLARYLDVIHSCGLREEIAWGIEDSDGRLWRNVPNRKWHAQQSAKSPGAHEVVLMHRADQSAISPSPPTPQPDHQYQDSQTQGRSEQA